MKLRVFFAQPTLGILDFFSGRRWSELSSLDQSFELRGRIEEQETGEPAQGLTVQAFDFDSNKAHDPLGEATTLDADGQFSISFTLREAGSRSEGLPEPFVIVKREVENSFVTQTSPLKLTDATQAIIDLGTISVGVAVDEGQTPTVISTEGDPPKPNDPNKPAGGRPLHGSKTREVVAPRSPFFKGPFGRLFRELSAWVPPGDTENDKILKLKDLANTMTQDSGDDVAGDNEKIPAGYTYFGQFVDHDITFDPGSSLQKQNDPERLHNFRTPAFDLDNLYGGGIDDNPYLFNRQPKEDGKFLIGKGRAQGTSDDEIDLFQLPATSEDDLPRNQQGVAIIGDPRNDENLIVAQLQLAFLKFHNATVKWIEEERKLTGREAFTRAQNLVRWHYQWVVLFDYLPRLIGPDLHKALVTKPKEKVPQYRFELEFFKWKHQPYMPVEFSVAAYRFGHSQIRSKYLLNKDIGSFPIFRPPSSNPGPTADLRGGRPLPARWSMDWRHFFEFGEIVPQKTRLINTKLSGALAKISAGPGGENSLAFLNLVRGWRMGLPSGEAVARAMGLEPLSEEELQPVSELVRETPLWYYILREAEVKHSGQHLGPVGGRIVGETFLGLAKGDPNSFININPKWDPRKFGMVDIPGDDLKLKDLLQFAGVGGDPFGA